MRWPKREAAVRTWAEKNEQGLRIWRHKCNNGEMKKPHFASLCQVTSASFCIFIYFASVTSIRISTQNFEIHNSVCGFHKQPLHESTAYSLQRCGDPLSDDSTKYVYTYIFFFPQKFESALLRESWLLNSAVYSCHLRAYLWKLTVVNLVIKYQKSIVFYYVWTEYV